MLGSIIAMPFKLNYSRYFPCVMNIFPMHATILFPLKEVKKCNEKVKSIFLKPSLFPMWHHQSFNILPWIQIHKALLLLCGTFATPPMTWLCFETQSSLYALINIFPKTPINKLYSWDSRDFYILFFQSKFIFLHKYWLIKYIILVGFASF